MWYQLKTRVFSNCSYLPVHSSEDPEAPSKSTSLWSWRSCLAPRRVQNTLLLVFLVILIFALTRYTDIPVTLGEFVPPSNSSVVEMEHQHKEEKVEPVTAPVDGITVPDVKWTDFAYVQYVTNAHYLCNSLMILESLHRLGSEADRVMMYPQQWQIPADDRSNANFESKMLVKARNEYKTKLVPIEVQTSEYNNDPTWKDSYTKLLAFNLTEYKRVISLDSDATVTKHMDELFFLPSAPVAMPRAFWMDKFFLSSQLVVIEPSEFDWKRIQHAINHHAENDYDMDILNKMYGDSCTIIPHRRYDLMTGEFRSAHHEKYLGSKEEPWSARKAVAEASFIHFSDWPMPKPWLKPSADETERNQPKCKQTAEGGQDCEDRDVWLELRADFANRRQRICGHAFDGARGVRRDGISAAANRSKYEPIFPWEDEVKR
ncbi:nucleotide-diphospho-sugar transferase [Delitschia confertaspora ATCC 74209]|uniref:Nucleotide-diphospho-sugar transferase n=1 Tax=Delitschia confertaspora ATCC 74209 TaxID=1513339 RepID=A0A9P4JG18_9PLEO|nr:nucleotide-diphospho-sugar transferase [Delitschia confertaspora ATCC 74209]